MVELSRTRILIGNGVPGYCPAGPFAPDSPINEPFGLIMGPDSRLYFCDLGNHRICAIDLQQNTLECIVGTGEAGNSGDGGPAQDAQITEPYELRFDSSGNLFFVDMKAHVVRKVDLNGIITTIAGTGTPGFGGDGGQAASAQFDQPHAIEISPDDQTLYIADIGNHRLRAMDLTRGVISTLAGNGEPGPTPAACSLANTAIHGPRTLALGQRNEVFLALREGNAIYRLDLSEHRATQIAGNGKFGYAGDGGPALDARLAGPKGIATGAGQVYFADTESHTIRAIDLQDHSIRTIVGTGHAGFVDTTQPLDCPLARPHGVCLDHLGRLYIGDSDNHCIRIVE